MAPVGLLIAICDKNNVVTLSGGWLVVRNNNGWLSERRPSCRGLSGTSDVIIRYPVQKPVLDFAKRGAGSLIDVTYNKSKVYIHTLRTNARAYT